MTFLNQHTVIWYLRIYSTTLKFMNGNGLYLILYVLLRFSDRIPTLFTIGVPWVKKSISYMYEGSDLRGVNPQLW